MTPAEFIFVAIVLYLLYRFVFNFLLPVMRATHQVRQQFRNMQSGNPPNFGPHDQFASHHTSESQTSSARSNPASQPKGTYKPSADDYIDFEEIKK
jgi:hypothetical protein